MDQGGRLNSRLSKFHQVIGESSMSHYHAVVWLDHREARVIHFNPAEAEEAVVRSEGDRKSVV
jgi:hypothetical protein